MSDAEMRPGESDIDWADRTYHTGYNGLHVCGKGVVGGRDITVTVRSVAMDADDARRIFECAKLALYSPRDPADLCIDLIIDGDLVGYFTICRQLLPQFAEIAAEQQAEDCPTQWLEGLRR